MQIFPSPGVLFQACIILLHLNWETQQFITRASFGDLFAFLHWHHTCRAVTRAAMQPVLRCMVCFLQLRARSVTISGAFWLYAEVIISAFWGRGALSSVGSMRCSGGQTSTLELAEPLGTLGGWFSWLCCDRSEQFWHFAELHGGVFQKAVDQPSLPFKYYVIKIT